ncbi:DUF4401 domain-containing protein [Psychrobacter glaciei]|uniref:DUF4401 domain-containing protein n=1 Tax=Psychrobacter glaciei TaxID=619771 RepID=UPI001F066B27|nr:DUF4401 domain-containing protein [Psychrobacter glaciei]MCH1783119.1 DUF4401 domain-containing protein [Psychrobacter glaciei]
MTNDMNDEQRRRLLLLQQHGFINEQNGNDSLLNQTESEEHTPWFINILFGFSGIFASLLFIGFLTLILFETEIFDSIIGVLVTGGILSAIGWSLFYNAHLRHSPFWNSLAFAITIAGQGYIAFALLTNEIEQPVSVIILLLIQLFMTIVMPNFIYRLLSAMVALGCVIYLLNFYYLPELSLGLLALMTAVANLQRYSILQRISVKWRSAAFDISKALSYASALMLLSISVYFIAAEYGGSFDSLDSYGDTFSYNYYLAQGLLTLASLYAALLILKRYQVKLLSAAGFIIVFAIAILGIMSIYVSGLLTTSLIIVIAVANSQRVLLGLGITALVGYIFWYYYQLDTSLLVKSASMLSIGIGLLLMRWLLIKRYFSISKGSGEALTVANEKERLS